jgi:hypothetical protein
MGEKDFPVSRRSARNAIGLEKCGSFLQLCEQFQFQRTAGSLLAALIILIIFAAGCSKEEEEPTPEPKPTVLQRIAVPPAGQYYHSVYPGGVTGAEDDITAADVDAYENAVGHRVAWVYFSHNWYNGRAFPSATADWIRARGSVPFIRLMLRSNCEQDIAEPLFTLAAIENGTFDSDLRAWGAAARAFATALIVEWGTEMNGRWFSWNGVWNGGAGEGPRRFREAFRRIVGIIRGQGATNITWVFHVNNEDDPDMEWNRLENYYPGDDVIDWLGVSVYGAQTPLDDEWPIFSKGLDAVAPRIMALAPDKPLFILEFGVSAGNPLGKPGPWANSALSSMLANRWPQIRGFSWWNERWENDDNPEHNTNMQVQSVPGLAEVFRRCLASNNVIDRPILE